MIRVKFSQLFNHWDHKSTSKNYTWWFINMGICINIFKRGTAAWFLLFFSLIFLSLKSKSYHLCDTDQGWMSIFCLDFVIAGPELMPPCLLVESKMTLSWGLPTSSHSGYPKSEIIFQIILQSSCFSGSQTASCSHIPPVEVFLLWRQVSDSWINTVQVLTVMLFVFQFDEWGCEPRQHFINTFLCVLNF